MAERGGSAEPSVLGSVGRNITVIGSIVAAIVGMNTALTTCSNQTIARHQTFRQAVNAEEQYWRDLYSDYLATFGKNIETDEREARLYALGVLADRQIPKFDEYSLGYFGGDGAKTLARDRLVTMKDRLQEALSRKESSTPAVAIKQQDQAFAAAVQNVRTAVDRQADQASPPPPVVQSPSIDAGVSYQTQTFAVGDPKGWDFDVFWCGGGETRAEAANYRTGLAGARALADFSSSGRRVDGELIGRVRLVMLPAQRQGGSYPSSGSGNEIRADGMRAERKLADAVRKAIPGGATYKLTSNQTTPSRFYIGLFSCAAAQPPAVRLAPDPAAARD